MALWQMWWAWIVGGAAIGILEIFAPGFVFLGFSIGAVLTGIVLLIVPGIGVPALLLLFAVLSLGAWWGMRRAVGVRKGQHRIVDRDINEN